MVANYDVNLDEILNKCSDNFSERIHLSRKKLIFGYVMGIITTRNVHFTEIANILNPEVDSASNLRRIQAFFADYELDYQLIALFLLTFVIKRRCVISLDRTNWKFGVADINVLALTVYYQGVGVPVLFELLDKRGNSNTVERVDLLEQFIVLFGKKRIKRIVADREFVGKKWVKWLVDQQINFCLRVPSSHNVTLRNGQQQPIKELCKKKERFFEGVMVDDQRVNLYIKLLENHDALILIGLESSKQLATYYRNRWCIETFFQSIKERGFYLENTHLKDLVKLKKLFALISIAFVICLKTGIYYHENVAEIRVKKDGYKENSFFRKGLDLWQQICFHICLKVDKLKRYFEILANRWISNFNQLIL